MPAVALLTSAHLLMVLLQSPEKVVTDDVLEGRARATAEPVATRPETRRRAGTAAVERRIVAHLAERGSWPTGPQVGAWLGKSSKTGGRLVNRVREAAGN